MPNMSQGKKTGGYPIEFKKFKRGACATKAGRPFGPVPEEGVPGSEQ